MSSSASLLPCVLFLIILSSSSNLGNAKVPPSKTFKYVNHGGYSYGHLNGVEYDAVYIPLNISNYPFSLYFYSYSTTSDIHSYILGIGMGNPDARPSLLRWIWSANRAYPVKENATFTFGPNGNLILTDANGRVAWQTRTANKGVIDLKLLPNGNLVLLDKKGRFVWQSFHYPTDTLLIGQSLRPGTSYNKLVSSTSDRDGSQGDYSMAVESTTVDLFFQSPHSSKALRYYNLIRTDLEHRIKNLMFEVAPASEGPEYANELRLTTGHPHLPVVLDWVQPKYNSTLSILRLGWDGNLHVYTYYENGHTNFWEETYIQFTPSSSPDECVLPEKCGSFGLCRKSQCIACPTPNGLMGWNDQCKATKLPPCNGNGAANVSYYRVEGVEQHFMVTDEREGEGPMKVGQCKKKCTKDCKCAGFYFEKLSSWCLLTYELNTLIKVTDPTYSTMRLLFIKYAK